MFKHLNKIFLLILPLYIIADWKLPPIPVTTGTDLTTAKVICNNDGTAMAFWLTFNSAIATAQYNGTVWVVGPTISVGGVSVYQVSSDQEGKVFVIWQSNNGIFNQQFIEANYFNGSTWSGVQILAQTDGINIIDLSQPQICVSTNGTAMAVWSTTTLNGAFTEDLIYFSRFHSGAWDSSLQLPSSAADSADPNLCCDSAGNVFAVWSFNNHMIEAAKFDSQAMSWTSLNVASGTSANAVLPSVCCDDLGNVVAVWLDNAANSVRGSYYNNGSIPSWSSDFTQLSDNSIVNVVGYNICCTNNLNVTVIWNAHDVTNTNALIQATRFNGASLTPSTTLIFPIATLDSVLFADDDFSTPQVSCCSASNALAVWEQIDQNTNEGQILASNFNGSWATPIPLSNPALDTTVPYVCCIANGNGIAVWAIGGSDSFVDSAFFTSFIAPLPPATFTGCRLTNRFATQSGQFALLNWTASPSADVLRYRIYRNGVLIIELPSTSFSFKDCLIPCGSITYSITSVNAAGESLPDTVVL